VAFALGLALTAVATAAWSTQTVDATADSGFFNSLAFNPVTGFPAISYSGPGAHNQNSVEFAQWNGVSWDIETVATAKGDDPQVSLAFDTAGNPSVAFSLGGVKFAHRTGSTWTSQTIDSKGGGNVSLVYQSGQPWVAYATSSALKLAHQTGSSWSSETVDGSGMTYLSLAFAPDGNPSIAYRSGTGVSTLRLAHKAGGAWMVQNVGTGTYYGIFASLAYDPLSGNPTISHSNGTELRFHRWDGSQWLLETAATGTCSYSWLTYDAAGIAAISYELAPGPSGYKQVRLARRTACSGTCWQDELVVDITPLLLGYRTSLAFGPTGAAVIAYSLASPYTLQFAQQTP
jgi:hypothetical protein